MKKIDKVIYQVNEMSLSHITGEEETLDLREDFYLSKLAEEAEERAKGKLSIPLDLSIIY